MPLYEFVCPNGHDFEKFYRSIGASGAEETCPACGRVGSRRISAAGLVFKGTGFYITDYGKDGKKAERESAAKPAAAESGEGSKATSETKSADSAAPTGSASPESGSKPATESPAPAAASKKETAQPASTTSKKTG